MEIRQIGLEQIANTQAVITIESVSSDTWRKSATLASEIANNKRYQDLVIEAVELARSGDLKVEESADALEKCERFIRENFGGRPYLDSGVEHAAYMAVLGEINRKK